MVKPILRNAIQSAVLTLLFSVLVFNAAADGTSVDPHHLPVGDQKISAAPERGSIYSCMTQFNGGGAFTDGPWFNGDGTWDRTKKLTVDGAVEWANYIFSIEVVGDTRVVTGNGLPNHPTGVFPIQPSDDAYQYDRNPNSISEQTIAFTLPLNPTLADQTSCEGGQVGVMLNGIPLFNGFDAGGRDAVAHEVQDDCDGHPQEAGQYHYHDLSPCIAALDTGTGHSALVGYAMDGFGIYGFRGEDGQVLTDDDLDECHGHTHAIEWNGQTVVMYHYHATQEFPYVVGCYRGTPAHFDPGMGQGRGFPPPGGQGQGQGPRQRQGQGMLPPPPPGQGFPPPPFGQIPGQGTLPPPPPGQGG